MSFLIEIQHKNTINLEIEYVLLQQYCILQHVQIIKEGSLYSA